MPVEGRNVAHTTGKPFESSAFFFSVKRAHTPSRDQDPSVETFVSLWNITIDVANSAVICMISTWRFAFASSRKLHLTLYETDCLI